MGEEWVEYCTQKSDIGSSDHSNGFGLTPITINDRSIALTTNPTIDLVINFNKFNDEINWTLLTVNGFVCEKRYYITKQSILAVFVTAVEQSLPSEQQRGQLKGELNATWLLLPFPNALVIFKNVAMSIYTGASLSSEIDPCIMVKHGIVLREFSASECRLRVSPRFELMK